MCMGDITANRTEMALVHIELYSLMRKIDRNRICSNCG